VHDLERVIKIATSAAEVAAGHLEIVWSATRRQAERESAARQPVDAGRCLPKQ
jgi:hypothetical protein